MWTSPSCVASLDHPRQRIRISRSLYSAAYHIDVDIVTVHHFEETINGRRYAIEVTPAQGDRWRAYLVRAAGGPTALMPFYGGTPQAAVASLVAWLSLAHRVATDSV